MKKKFKETDLPIYEAVIDESDETTGFKLISIVKDPAIGVMAMAFSQMDKIEIKLKVVEDKQLLIGPALIPDLKIYRSDQYGEYYTIFRAEQIRKMVERFNKNGSNKKINFNHSNKMIDAYIMQDFIIEDPVYNNARAYGYDDLPVGTYFIVCKVEDKKFWDTYIKDEGFQGFSVEGLFGMRLIELNKNFDMELEEIVQDIDYISELMEDLDDNELSMVETYKPTDGMVEEAQRGLDWVKEYKRGGTNIGRGRATDIVNRRNFSYDTVKRVKAYFDRHEVDKQGKGWSPGEDGFPSNGRIAWALWGGDAGWSWSKAIVERVEREKENKS
jgi:hypothetical protein